VTGLPDPRTVRKTSLAAACLLVLSGTLALDATTPVELKAVDAIPAHLVGAFEEPIAAHRLDDGRVLVFDRRAHAVFAVDAARTSANKIVQVGQEPGRVLQPTAFDASPDGRFVVADAPNRRERVQLFDPNGQRLAGFDLPGRASPRVFVSNFVLSGVGSLRFTGRTVLINHPETGALITEYDISGYPLRSIGRLRPTSHESDRALHLALNTGLPLSAPDGGHYFVFQTGEPRFRKYDRRGQLVFERLIQGREIDPLVSALPSVWPRRRIEDEELPLVAPVVRTAAVDRSGGLWVVFTVPITYRFDADGDRTGSYRFRATGPILPTSLFFGSGGRVLVTPGLFEFRVP
jgi:hypothetical protein